MPLVQADKSLEAVRCWLEWSRRSHRFSGSGEGDEDARRPLHGRHGVLPATGDIRATQQLLGHKDIGTAANIYVQPNEASLERKLAEIYEAGDADNDSARPL